MTFIVPAAAIVALNTATTAANTARIAAGLVGGVGAGDRASALPISAKLCVECKHYIKPGFMDRLLMGNAWAFAHDSKCGRYLTDTQRLVGSGEYKGAALCREFGPCGEEASGWEPK